MVAKFQLVDAVDIYENCATIPDGRQKLKIDVSRLGENRCLSSILWVVRFSVCSILPCVTQLVYKPTFVTLTFAQKYGKIYTLIR